MSSSRYNSAGSRLKKYRKGHGILPRPLPVGWTPLLTLHSSPRRLWHFKPRAFGTCLSQNPKYATVFVNEFVCGVSGWISLQEPRSELHQIFCACCLSHAVLSSPDGIVTRYIRTSYMRTSVVWMTSISYNGSYNSVTLPRSIASLQCRVFYVSAAQRRVPTWGLGDEWRRTLQETCSDSLVQTDQRSRRKTCVSLTSPRSDPTMSTIAEKCPNKDDVALYEYEPFGSASSPKMLHQLAGVAYPRDGNVWRR